MEGTKAIPIQTVANSLDLSDSSIPTIASVMSLVGANMAAVAEKMGISGSTVLDGAAGSTTATTNGDSSTTKGLPSILLCVCVVV